MAAGLGFKTFTTGEVLTAADTNGYLMQGILVFASSAARTSAVTSPQEGQYSYLKDTNALEYYDGAAWVGAPVGDITAVTAGTGISGGGSSGDVTITNSMATAIDAKGDLVAGTADNTFSRLAVGTNNYFLQAASGQATGLQWGGTFSTYTPVLYQNGTVTTSTATGRYIQIGKIVYGSVFIVASGTGTASNRVKVSHPVTPANLSVFSPIGNGMLYDASSGLVYPDQVVAEDATYFNFTITQAIASNGGQYVGVTGFTAAVAVGDQIGFTFTYEAA